MKSILLSLLLAGCATPLPRAPCYDVASSPNVPHKGEKLGCFLYAEAVAPLLKQAGATDIHRVTYKWMDADFGNYQSSPIVSRGLHTVVAYTDPLGQNWICDNQWPWPKHTRGETMQERCDWFADYGLTVVSDVVVK